MLYLCWSLVPSLEALLLNPEVSLFSILPDEVSF